MKWGWTTLKQNLALNNDDQEYKMFRMQEILIPMSPPLLFLFPPQPCCLSVPLFSCIIVLPTIQIKLIQIVIQSISIMKSIMEWISTCPVHGEVEPSTSHLSTTYQLPTAALTYNFNKIHLKAFLATTNTFDTYIINPFQSHYWPLPLLCFPSFPLPLFPLNMPSSLITSTNSRTFS